MGGFIVCRMVWFWEIGVSIDIRYLLLHSSLKSAQGGYTRGSFELGYTQKFTGYIMGMVARMKLTQTKFGGWTAVALRQEMLKTTEREPAGPWLLSNYWCVSWSRAWYHPEIVFQQRSFLRLSAWKSSNLGSSL